MNFALTMIRSRSKIDPGRHEQGSKVGEIGLVWEGEGGEGGAREL